MRPKNHLKPGLSLGFQSDRRAFLDSILSLTSSLIGTAAWGQSANTQTTESPVYIDPVTTRWAFTLSLDTPSTLTQAIATFAIPTEWPEQKVTLTGQDVDPRVGSLEIRPLPKSQRQSPGAKQVAVAIPRVTAGSTLQVRFEFQIEKRKIEAPSQTESLVVPKRIDRSLREFMGVSPKIDATHRDIKALSRELDQLEHANAWQMVREIYNTTREKVKYVEGPIRNASDALRDGKGDCEDLTSLFVALCRNAGVPARMVWVPGHCYPEFYLESAESGQGYWYPCQAAGTEAFGSMDEERPILQKGDRFRVMGERQPVRYITETFRCATIGRGEPRFTFKREKLDTTP